MSVNVHLNLVILVDVKCILGRLSSAGWLLEIANPLCHIPNYKLLSKQSKAWWPSLWAVFTFTQVFCWEPRPPWDSWEKGRPLSRAAIMKFFHYRHYVVVVNNLPHVRTWHSSGRPFEVTTSTFPNCGKYVSVPPLGSHGTLRSNKYHPSPKLTTPRYLIHTWPTWKWPIDIRSKCLSALYLILVLFTLR